MIVSDRKYSAPCSCFQTRRGKPAPRRLAAFGLGLLWLSLFPLVLAEPRMTHVPVVLRLSPDIVRQAVDESPLYLQILVLRLNTGSIHYHEMGRIQPEKGNAPQGEGVFTRLLLLGKGEYLIEVLVYSPDHDPFAFFARPLSVPEAPAPELKVALKVAALDRTGFKKLRLDLVYDGVQWESVFYDHMLWARVRNQSLRSAEEKAALFEKLKLASADLEYSPYAYKLLGKDLDDIIDGPPEAPDSLKRAYRKIFSSIIVDRIYEVAILADNLGCLVSPWGKAPSQEQVKNAGKAAGKFKQKASDLLNRWKWDKPGFEKSVKNLDLEALSALATESAADLDRAVAAFFFQVFDKTATRGEKIVSPLVYAEQVQKVCKRAGKLAAANRP